MIHCCHQPARISHKPSLKAKNTIEPLAGLSLVTGRHGGLQNKYFYWTNNKKGGIIQIKAISSCTKPETSDFERKSFEIYKREDQRPPVIYQLFFFFKFLVPLRWINLTFTYAHTELNLCWNTAVYIQKSCSSPGQSRSRLRVFSINQHPEKINHVFIQSSGFRSACE